MNRQAPVYKNFGYIRLRRKDLTYPLVGISPANGKKVVLHYNSIPWVTRTICQHENSICLTRECINQWAEGWSFYAIQMPTTVEFLEGAQYLSIYIDSIIA